MLRRWYNSVGCFAVGLEPWLQEQSLWGAIILVSKVFGG